MSKRASSPHHTRLSRGSRALISSVLAFALALPLTLAGVLFAPAEAVNGTLEVTKSVDSPGPYAPGQTMTFTVAVTCQSSPCAGAELTDTLPPPLVLDGDDAVQVSAAGGGTYDLSGSDGDGGTHVVVDATQVQEDGNPGMAPGTTAQITIRARVPADATADYNGTVTNTADVTQDGGNSDSDTADVQIDVEPDIATTVTKTASTDSVPAVPGQPVSFTIDATNTSNEAVDSLVVSDPSDDGADPFALLALTGISSFTPPDGADTVQVAWTDADGTVTTLDPVSPIPSDPNALLAGVPLDEVHGLTFTFTGPDGIPIDGEANIVLATETRDDVADIPDGTTETVTNTAQSDVTSDDGDATATDDAAVDIISEPPTVQTTKEFDDDHLLAGDSTTATIRPVVGDRPVSEMVISEPTDGEPDLAAQGLTFGGFTDDAAWPAGADHISIEYTFANGDTQTVTSDTRDEFPAPTDQAEDQVTGFTITFTSDDPDGIETGDFANVPFDVTAQAVTGEDDVTTTNETTTDVTADDGSTGTDDASDDVTRQPARIDTNVDKVFTPDEILGVPGARTVVELPAEVCGQTEVDAGTCDQTSTVPSDDLIVSDPANPGETPTEFWDHMNLTSIGPMDIPAGSTLQVNYWNGSAWVPLAGPITADQSPWTYQIGSDPSPDDIQGIQFDFEPTDPDVGLPPGFKVEPYLSFSHRATLRSDPGTSALPTGTDPVTYTNDVESQVDNPDADESPVTDDDAADITVDPTDGSGPGDSVDKGWVDPDTGEVFDTGVLVPALTDDERTARVSWGTGGYPMSQVQLSDVPDPATGDAVADTVYDAFDLVRIDPITTSTDPLIAFDEVSKVELFSASANGGAGGWVDITAAACANGCDGTFGGYTLTAAEQDSTLSVRLTFVESPTRASRITSPSDPPVGSGVAGSVGNDRPVDLTFRIRQDMRVSGDPVLGNDPDNGDQPYNTGTDGLVSNTVGMDSWAPGTPVTDPPDYQDTDSAEITITDRPVNVSTTKQFEESVLGLPPDGTAAGDYPKDALTLTANNDTNAKVRTMTIQDPAPDPSPDSNTFDLMNLTGFLSIDAPSGADASQTEVFLTRGGTEDPAITADAALALGPGDLADVTGVRVVFHGLIVTTTDSTTPARVVLDMQLRADHRSDGTPLTEADSVDNYSFASATNPEDTATGTDNDTVNIEQPTYDVDAAKNIDPASRYEGDTNAYTVDLTGKPTGTVRTTVLTITDDDPLFWNAFDFTGFPAQTVNAPISRVQVDALVGVTYSLDGSTLVQQCNGSDDLTDCWVDGEPVDAASPALPAGVAAADVQGLRFTYDAGEGQPNWEHPSNPTAHATFSAVQRDNLRWSTEGENVTPVPSDLSTNDLAPGETVLGRTNNTIQVHSEGSWNNGEGPWTADADANDSTDYLHLPNSVSITKSPGNGNNNPTDESPNSPIAYQFVVTNTGQWPQTGVTIVDTLPTDDGGPQLVPASQDVPADGECADYPDAVIQLRGADGSEDPIAGASAQYCMSVDGDPSISVTLPDDFVLAPGNAIVVSTPLEYRGGSDPVDPGVDVVNSVTVSDDRIYDECDSTHNATVDNPTETDVYTCTSDTTTQPRALTPLRITKAVRGLGGGDPAVAPDDPNYDDLGVIDVDANDENASGCQSPSVPDYDESVVYYDESCVPMLRPGGLARWQVRLVNAGNIPAHIVAGIDVLPTPGDTGVVVPTPRDSEWRPRLVGNFRYDGAPVDASTPMKLYYTTDTLDEECNEADILNETTEGGIWTDPEYADLAHCQGDVEGRTWLTVTSDTPESQLTQATALKAVLTYGVLDEGLAPGDDLALTFDTRTPAYAPQTTPGQDTIAWNSVAEGSQGVYRDPDTGDLSHPVSLVTEPPKVGVAMATGSVRLTKTTLTPDGTDFPLPDTYPVKLICTSVGAFDQPIPVPVTVVDQDGTDRSVVDVPRNGTITVNDRANPGDNTWSNVTIPWGAACRAQETPTPQGATVTYDPSPLLPDLTLSGPITALQDYSDRTDIAHPIDTSPDTIEGITVTNTYEEGGFSVTKAVDTGGAVDQDGNPIVYDRTYDFTASCTFNDTEVVPADQQSFTLGDGDTETVTGLPAGSDCTVTETDDGGAASTTIDTTTADGATDPVDGTSTDFVITPDTDQTDPTTITNTVDVTNTYTVGSVVVTKSLAGDGADDWGDGPFVVHMTCTLDGTDPDPVYDADHTFTPPDDLVWTVEDLPTGASCQVTEPEDGGANSVAVDPSPAIVGDDATDDATPISVTNTFTEGEVTATKNFAGLTGTTLDQAMDRTYTFELACTREVNGETVDVPIPGDNPVDVVPSDDPTATWSGLPTGATCTVTEQFPDDATNPPTPSYDPATVTVGDGTTVNVDVTNTFETAPLSVVKVVDGDAADAGAASYPVTADCTYDGTELAIDPDDPDGTPGPYSFDVVPGTPSTTGPLPIGTTCTVTEDDNEGATSTTISNDGVVTIASLADDPDADTVTITNTYDATGFTVSKAVDDGGAVDQDGDDIAYTRTYGFTASCTLNGNEQVDPADRTFTLQDGDTKTIDGIAVNSVCVVTETATGGAASTTMVVTQDGTAADETTGSSSGEFTLDAGGADINAVAVTNHYTVGSVQVTKDVTGDGADDWGQGPFTVHMVCTLAGTDPNPVYEADHTLTPPDDLVWTVDNLPTGASCAVTEPDDGDGGANSTTISPSPVTVGDDPQNPVAVDVTNTFTEGNVTVRKVIGGLDPDSTQYQEAMDATYTFSLACTREVNGETVDVPIPGDNPIEVVPSEDREGTWTGLPTGARCQVTEEFAPDQQTPPIVVTLPRTVTVGVGDSTTLVRTLNGFRVAPLTIEKVVDGDAADAAPDTFPVTVACFYGEGDNRVALPVEDVNDNPGPVQEEIGPDQPFTTIGLPIGSDCTVTEVDDGGATSTTVTGTNVSSTSDDSGTATLVVPAGDDTANTLTITNTFDDTGFTVTKRVDTDAVDADGDPVRYSGPFTFSASCVFDGTEQLADADRTFSLGEGGTHAVTGVPVNSVCQVEETSTAGASATDVTVTQGDQTVQQDGTSSGGFVLDAGGADVNAVAVTNHFTVGAVQVTKQITGGGATARGAGPFEVRLVCTLTTADPTTVYDATHDLKPGDLVWTVDDLPTGATCAVSEPDDGGADATTISPASITVGDGTTAKVTVTNQFELVPVPPSPTSTEAGGGLAPTGFDSLRLGLLVAGLLGLGLVVIGAALWSRRRS
ncbi:DUF5979 domain-containing protein [Luteimicrobium subarcticum]|uniref:Uncharacterized protein DUF11 n=1 Tax=Luteimicrobium subarcticum TaxID=620910 RepID=A0A2M8W6T3_9MICO|nr:DUF5979 domain-containing protein [Luteimicrobium subarcticum]PJI86638.1 uncharacterized protein DUF11 [Luteimicrobium subarcticum]